MLQGANTDIFNQLAPNFPNTHNSEGHNIPFPLQIKNIKSQPKLIGKFLKKAKFVFGLEKAKPGNPGLYTVHRAPCDIALHPTCCSGPGPETFFCFLVVFCASSFFWLCR